MSQTLIKQIANTLKHNDTVILNKILDDKIFINTVNPNISSYTQDSYKINTIPPEGLVLSKPGKYIFSNDIVWEAENNICISIISNDITLDLNNHILTCNNTELKTIGIHCNGFNNIKIRNGTLLNFVYKGIDINKYSKIKIDNIIVDGLSWNTIGNPNENTPVGIFCNEGSKLYIKNSTVKNINVRTDSSAAFQIVDSSNIKIYKCNVIDYINNDGSVQGFSTILSEKCSVRKCQTSNLQSFFNGNIFTAGHTVLGFIPILCNDIIYNDCKAQNLFGSCDDVHGMSIFLNTNIIVDNFYARNVIDGFSTNVGAKATGLEVYGSNIKIYNSYVKDISAINPQDKQATGFSCAMGSNIEFNNCVAKNVSVVDGNGDKSKEIGYGTGFGWAPDPRPLFTFPVEKVLYKNCKTKNCQVGFDSWYHIDSVWNDLDIKYCDIAILNEGKSNRAYFCDACSECIVPIETTLTNVAKDNKFYCIRIKY